MRTCLDRGVDSRKVSAYVASANVDLVGTSEIADLLGVSRQRVFQLSLEPHFPAPVASLTAGKFWRRSDVERWARDHDRPLRNDRD